VQGSKGNEKAISTTVAIVPGAASYPHVRRTIDDKWKVVEILKGSEEEFLVRVEPLKAQAF
jgi:hypothetical protein